MALPYSNQIKLIATDLDGTLLNSNGEVSENSRKIIKTILQKYPNLYFVLASGRAKPAAKSIREALNLNEYPNSPSILLNGCIVYSSDEKIMWQSYLNSKIILEHIEIMKQLPNIDFIYSSGDDAIMFNDKWKKMAEEKFQEKACVVDKEEFLEAVKKEERFVNKICYLVPNQKDVELVEKTLAEFQKKYNLESARSANIFLEYMPDNVNKGNSLKQLIKMLNIKKEEVITFGDAGNDFELLNEAGWSVAVENAVEKLRQNAKIITKSNNEDGVAKLLEKIFLTNEAN